MSNGLDGYAEGGVKAERGEKPGRLSERTSVRVLASLACYVDNVCLRRLAHEFFAVRLLHARARR
ncbi:MAG: hypothetical protein ACXWZY_06020 [Gaiellaceae bacterium]